MEFVVTLIAEKQGALVDTAVDQVRGALEGLSAETGPPSWLADAWACDIPFDHLSPDQADAAARAILSEEIDIVAQPVAGRRKKLLIADMDSTMVTTETLTDLAEIAGCGDVIDQITDRVMRGELDFAQSLKERVKLLKGLSEDALAEAYAGIVPTEGAETAVKTLAANGVHAVLASGGFRYFTSRMAKRLGFHADHANDFIIKNGKLTGKVVEPVLGRESKYEILVKLASEKGLGLAETVTIGDGANDLDMIRAAGLGVAFHAKPVVREAARARLNVADMRGLLFIQGFGEKDFVQT